MYLEYGLINTPQRTQMNRIVDVKAVVVLQILKLSLSSVGGMFIHLLPGAFNGGVAPGDADLDAVFAPQMLLNSQHDIVLTATVDGYQGPATTLQNTTKIAKGPGVLAAVVVSGEPHEHARVCVNTGAKVEAIASASFFVLI